MRKPRPPGLPALPLRQLERQRQLAVIAGEDQRWAIRLRMQEIELYRRLERGAPEARRVRHHDLAQVRQNRRNAEAERKAQRKHDAEERKAATARAKAQQAAETARARAQLAAKREGLPNGFVGDAAIEEGYWQQAQRRFRSYSIILRFAGIGQYAGVTKGPQLKKMHDDQCKIMGSKAHHALEERIWGIVAGGGALGVVAWFALQFQGELPEFLGTYGELIGPRPWRSHTMADDYGIQLEAAITRKLWYPSMLEIEETACSYGSYVGIPSIKESGGHMMAADMKKVNEDQVLDFGDDDDKPEEGGGTMSFEEYANQESKAAAGLAHLMMSRLTMAPPLVTKTRQGYETVNLALACDALRRQGERVIFEYARRTLARVIGKKEAEYPTVDTLKFLAEQADDDELGDDDDYDDAS